MTSLDLASALLGKLDQSDSLEFHLMLGIEELRVLDASF